MHGVYGMTGYQYDADGTRIGKGTVTSMSCDPSVNGYTATNDYILDQSGDQMTEMVPSGKGWMQWSHTNVWAAGALVATYDTAGLHFYLNDPLGTRRVQTDAAGYIEQSCQSLPYGDALQCPLADPTEHHFTGKERDTETGLDYFGARYYNSAFGRWMSPDWSAKVEPVPYAKLDDPQSLNLYGYLMNSPLVGIDADGHQQQQLLSTPTVPNAIGPSTAGYSEYISNLGGTLLGDGLALARIGVSGLLVPFALVQTMGDGTVHHPRAPGCYIDGVDVPPEPEPQVASGINGAGRRGGRPPTLFGINDLMQVLKPGQLNTVTITYTGSRRLDYQAANMASGHGTSLKPPVGYSWHHVADYNAKTNTGTMQLVLKDVHVEKGHSGGVAQYEKATGQKYK